MRKLKISYDPELEAKIEDLVMRAKNGDNEAFEELSDHYMSLIEIYANFFGHNAEIPKEDACCGSGVRNTGAASFTGRCSS